MSGTDRPGGDDAPDPGPDAPTGPPPAGPPTWGHPNWAQPGHPPTNHGDPRMPSPGYPRPGPADATFSGHPPAGYATRPGGIAVVPKNPAVSLIASFCVPGLGSMLNGEIAKGIGILFGYLVSLLLVVVLIGVVGAVGFWVYGMVDGYNGAKSWNARHGIYS